MPRPYTLSLQYGKQLQDAVTINQGHPHSQDLRWFVAPTTGAMEDLVSGIPPVLGDYKTNYPSLEGPGLRCPIGGAKNTQSAYWPMSGHLKGTWKQLTVMVRCVIDSLPTISYNSILTIPYNSTNSSPYGVNFQMNSTNNQAHWNSSDAGTTDMYASGATNPYVLGDGNIHEYVMAFDGAYCNFYRDGFQVDSPQSLWFGSAQPILIVNQPICVLSYPYPTQNLTGFKGTILSAGIWTRRLSSAELLSRFERPYQHLHSV